MKIIDLLNKIANDEEVPKIVKYDSVYYTYDKGHYTWFEDLDCVSYDLAVDGNLNDEVEIIEEEKKIPEKIDYQENEYGTFYLNHKKYNSEPIKILSKKINELIDEINKLKEGK